MNLVGVAALLCLAAPALAGSVSAQSDKRGPPPIPLDCQLVREADVREECLAALPGGTPRGIWSTQHAFDHGWTYRRDVIMTGPASVQVQYYWQATALDFRPEDFRKPALYFICIIPSAGNPSMRLNYSHEKIRLAMPPLAGVSWRRGKLRVVLDGEEEIIDFPRWTVQWLMHDSEQTRTTLDRWTGRKEAKIFHDAALENHPNRDGYAVFNLEPLARIRELMTEKCRW